MTNEISCIQSNLLPNQHEMQVFQIMAKQSAASGFYKSIGGEAQIMSILLVARELSIPPMLALSGGVWNINGKLEISARMMNTLIRRNGHSLQIIESNDKICTIEGKRKDNGDCFRTTFTIEDAQKAGLIRSGGNWTKYPTDMLFARALSRLARQLFSDCVAGCYVEGEIRDSFCEEKLQPSAYEEINIPINDIPVQEKVIQEPIEVISKEQCDVLLDKISGVNSDYAKLLYKHAKTNFGITSMSLLPQTQYDAFCNLVERALAKERSEKEEKMKIQTVSEERTSEEVQ